MQHRSRHDGDAPDHDRLAPGVARAFRRVGGRRAARVLAVVVVALYAWWVVALEPFSSRGTIAVVLAGAAATAIGARQRRSHRRSRQRSSGAGWWVVLGALAAAWQLAAYVQHPRADHPTISSLTNAVLDTRGARAAAFVVWIAAARTLARR